MSEAGGSTSIVVPIKRVPALVVGIGLLAAVGFAQSESPPAGVADPQLAWQHWVLNCQGCHRLDGTGSPGTAPALAGTVSRFLCAPNGREYLGRVPGVATSALSNADLAELLNWMLWRFDKGHVPSNFRPYTEAEVGRLRTQPLRLEASQMRAQLLKEAACAAPMSRPNEQG